MDCKDMLGSARRGGVQQFGFDLQLCSGLLQHRAIDQESVLHPFTERGDLGQLQVHMVAGQYAGDGIEQGLCGRWC